MSRHGLIKYVDDFLRTIDPSISQIWRTFTDFQVYEIFVYCIVANIFRRLGYRLRIKNLQSGNTFLFRRAPGRITSQSYSYLTIEKDGKGVYEIHKDINIKGRSGETHEVDVAILTNKEATAARNKNRDPQGNEISKLVGYFECKFYSKDLSKKIAREYIGLVIELNKRAVNSVVSNLSLSQMEKAKRILNKHELSIFNVHPSSSDTSFLGWVKGRLENMPEK